MKRRSSEDAAHADASDAASAGKRARATTTIAENPTGDDDVRGDARARRDATRRTTTTRDRGSPRDDRRRRVGRARARSRADDAGDGAFEREGREGRIRETNEDAMTDESRANADGSERTRSRTAGARGRRTPSRRRTAEKANGKPAGKAKAKANGGGKGATKGGARVDDRAIRAL